MRDSEELETLRRRVAEQRKEIARLHKERDLAWECSTIKFQSWRSMPLSSACMRTEEFVLRGRHVLGIIVSMPKGGFAMWYASYGAGVAASRGEAVQKIIEHDALSKKMREKLADLITP